MMYYILVLFQFLLSSSFLACVLYSDSLCMLHCVYLYFVFPLLGFSYFPAYFIELIYSFIAYFFMFLNHSFIPLFVLSMMYIFYFTDLNFFVLFFMKVFPVFPCCMNLFFILLLLIQLSLLFYGMYIITKHDSSCFVPACTHFLDANLCMILFCFLPQAIT